MLLLTINSFSQKTKVYGTVTDVESREPLPFVNVTFQGSKIGATTDFYDTQATSVERVWSDCTKFLSCNANVMAISSTGAGAWCTPPVNTQDETKLVGKVDLVYASANAGNMTETVVARTIVS